MIPRTPKEADCFSLDSPPVIAVPLDESGDSLVVLPPAKPELRNEMDGAPQVGN